MKINLLKLDLDHNLEKILKNMEADRRKILKIVEILNTFEKIDAIDDQYFKIFERLNGSLQEDLIDFDIVNQELMALIAYLKSLTYPDYFKSIQFNIAYSDKMITLDLILEFDYIGKEDTIIEMIFNQEIHTYLIR